MRNDLKKNIPKNGKPAETQPKENLCDGPKEQSFWSTQEEMLDSASAGRYLGGRGNPIPETTMIDWRTNRIGPKFIKLIHAVRYRKSDLDKFIEDNAQP